jgi:hypothetical protein
MKRTLRLILGLLAVFVVLAGQAPGVGVSSPVVVAAPTPADVHGVEELKVRFNHDAGKVRLVLLLSPT